MVPAGAIPREFLSAVFWWRGLFSTLCLLFSRGMRSGAAIVCPVSLPYTVLDSFGACNERSVLGSRLRAWVGSCFSDREEVWSAVTFCHVAF